MSELNDDPYAVAEAYGLRVVLPEPDELFLDIDDWDGAAQVQKAVWTLRGLDLPPVEVRRTPSGGGGAHAHVVLRLPFTVSPTERILLQACFGSDRLRELLSWLRIHLALDRPPTVFFEKKESDL